MHLRRYFAGWRALAWAASALFTVSCAGGPGPALNLLTQDAVQAMMLVQGEDADAPSFIRALIPLATMGASASDASEAPAYAFASRYAQLFGLEDAQQELQSVSNTVDALGIRHLRLDQVFQGVPVYGSRMYVHLTADGSQVAAVTNSVVPNLEVGSVQPTIDLAAARTVAADSLPNGVERSNQLAIYPGRERNDPRLAWLIELYDPELQPDTELPARELYVVDAQNGRVLDVLNKLYVARDRRTHSANNGASLPGTLSRSEGQGPSGDRDVDDAHDFAGDTYDYFSNTHGRDSYDDQGAALVSTANYRSNYQNAFWDGQQMVYGDGFATNDVAAHELTHAVTEFTANLEYVWQSGALNESFSDIFGAMVDRNDWLMGEDLPIGAIRNMENPGMFGDPGHVRDWLVTCSDQEGVHTNSGIHNRAFVNVANALGKDRAERIFYRALTWYLGPQSTMEDSHAAALQSASDIFGAGSVEVQETDNGFRAVGLDGNWSPRSRCGQTPDLSIWALLALVLLAMGTAMVLARRAEA